MKLTFPKLVIKKAYTKPETLDDQGRVKWPKRSYCELLEPYAVGLPVTSEAVDFKDLPEGELSNVEIEAVMTDGGKSGDRLLVKSLSHKQ